MRTSIWLTTLAAVAVAVSGAGAQPGLTRTGSGPVPDGGVFPDAGFQYAYSFGARGFSAGSAAGSAVLGAVGPCLVGEPCQSTASRDYLSGEPVYFVGLSFGGPFAGSPSLFVTDVVGGSTGTTLELTSYVPASPLNAFYVLLTAPPGAAVDISNLFFIGAPPTDVVGFGTTPGGQQYALYTSADDLRDNLLIFDLGISGGAGGAQALPSIDIYVGSLVTAQVVPEPATVGLTAVGLVGVFALVRRRRGLT